MFNTYKFVIFLRSRIIRYNTFFNIDVKTNTDVKFCLNCKCFILKIQFEKLCMLAWR